MGGQQSRRTLKKLDAAEIFIEINATDGDAGIQIFLDGEGWDRMRVFNPDGRKILDFKGKGSIGVQGITELFFESAEPSFEEQPLEDFLDLFPEGRYRFEGRTTDGLELKGKARLTHALPDAPVLVSPVDGDDAVDPNNTVLEWVPVPDPPGSEIVLYQVILGGEEPSLLDYQVEVGPDTMSMSVVLPSVTESLRSVVPSAGGPPLPSFTVTRRMASSWGQPEFSAAGAGHTDRNYLPLT